MIFLTEIINPEANNIAWSKIFSLSNIADVLGILAFILTIILLVRSEAIRKEIDCQRTDYQKEQKTIRANIIALRDNVRDDNLTNLRIISEVRTYLLSFKQKFKHLLSKEDKKHISVTLHLFEKDIDEINVKLLCAELDYFVARFDKKEVK